MPPYFIVYVVDWFDKLGVKVEGRDGTKRLDLQKRLLDIYIMLQSTCQ